MFQLAFRVAKKLKLKKLYAVDYRFKLGNLKDSLMKVVTNLKQDSLKNQILAMIKDRTSKVNQLISNTVKSFRIDNFLNNTWETDTNLRYDYNFQNGILGVFATGAYKNDVLGIKLGFRLENTNIKSVLKTTNERINQNYANLFPSLHTSYKFSDTFSLQFGYSRRIERPYPSRLFNFRAFGNNFQFSTGNRGLQPEFTDSYEIASIFKIEKVIFNIGLYHRYTTNVIENIITVDENIITSKPFNVGIDKTYGFEINGKYTVFNWASLTTDFNLLAFRQQGNYDHTNYDFKSNRSFW